MNTPRVTLARAHFLTQDPKILRELVLDCQSGLGANPLNISYTIGLGHDWPRNPLICDSRIGNLPPFPGITVYGPGDPIRLKDDFGQKLAAMATYPDVLSWPAADAYFDIFMFPITNEFTVMQSIAPQSYAMGYLAARK
jgi:endoglucanase